MTLTIAAPEGAHFEMEEVKTAKGTQSLGEVPILVWDTLDGARAQYGDEGITDMLDGTSARVSFQSIARRFKAAGKSSDEIAAAQVAFRPGKRVGGVSTPVSRARNAAGRAAERVGDSDALTALLEKIASGALSMDDINALAGSTS